MQATAQPRLTDRLSDLFWRRPGLFLVLLLALPLIWLGLIYIGSLAALLVQSFFSIDEFSGLINYEFTLKTYGELFRPANYDSHTVSSSEAWTTSWTSRNPFNKQPVKFRLE